MIMDFHSDTFYGYLISGNLNRAIAYVKQFPEQDSRYQKYRSVFEGACYFTYPSDAYLNQILTIYQQYYREAFYLDISPAIAAQNMLDRFLALLNLPSGAMELDCLEAQKISDVFTQRGFQFQGGRTCGYYGPYIWKTTETKTYDVVLPDGTLQYMVRFLDGFLSKSWLDYISFGEVSTGGWAGEDGIIHCIKASYDVQSEAFTVSLLKHEAQHAMDLQKYKHMSPEELEYRAKLVELIYSSKRNLLPQFLKEADRSQTHNGHSLASARIAAEFERKRNCQGPGTLSIAEIQSIAMDLFSESGEEMVAKYG